MSKSEKYWSLLSQKIKSPIETKNKRPDTSNVEIDLYMKYLSPETELLDLGSGSGIIINKLYDKVKSIWAIEKYPGFSQFIEDKDNILVINADLIGFKIRRKFDAILCTGVTQCLERNEASEMYKNCIEMLKEDGILILRSHCGINEDVIIDGYSKELDSVYYAEYRHKAAEINLLNKAGFKNVKTYDILPDSINVWENTRHYIFICKRNDS